MPRLAITSPSATSWSPGSTATTSPGTTSLGEQLDRRRRRGRPCACGATSTASSSRVALRLQLLADADVGVDHRDQAEDRVGVEPEPEVEDEEDADDRVEEGEDVAGDDARGRARGGLRRRPQLAQPRLPPRRWRGPARSPASVAIGAYSIGCAPDGAEARTQPRLLGHRPRRRGRPRGRARRPRTPASSRSGRPSPTAPTWSACSPGWRRRRRRSTSAPRSCRCPARPPAAAAMAGATIDKLSGGRFLFGFGPSGPQVSEGWYGVPYAKPWGRTREYIEVVREIIAREGPVEHQGEHYQLPLPGGEGKALKLNFHPERNEIPVFVGAIGRKSVEMAAEICDGWIPIFFSVDAFEADLGRAPRGRLRQGRAAALRPRGLALAAGRDRRRPGGGQERRQGRPRPLLRRHGQPQDQLLRRPRPPLRLRRRRRRGPAALPGRRPRRRLRGDARRDRRGDLAGRHRGRGRRAGRALPRRRHRPPDRLAGPRRARAAAAHARAPGRDGRRRGRAA